MWVTLILLLLLLSLSYVGCPSRLYSQEAAVKAQIEVKQKLKDTFAQLSEVEKAYRNAESVLKGYEKQVADALEAQKKAQDRLALTVVELKQTKKQLEAKDKEKAEAEQVAYNVGIKKIAESLTT